jgi:propionate CoA-transferase
VTERCVLRLDDGGLALIDAAPGIGLERDILRRLPFRPAIIGRRELDSWVFRNAPMRLPEQMPDLRMKDRPGFHERTNTVCMNYAGLRERARPEFAGRATGGGRRQPAVAPRPPSGRSCSP